MLQKRNKKPVHYIIGICGVIALFQTISILPEAEKSYVAMSNSFLGIWFCVLSAFVFDKVAKT